MCVCVCLCVCDREKERECVWEKDREYDTILYDMIWYDTLCYGMIQYDIIWYYTIWYNTIWCYVTWCYVKLLYKIWFYSIQMVLDSVKIKRASKSKQYDYLQRIPVYHMQIIVLMTLIYSNLSIWQLQPPEMIVHITMQEIVSP